MKINSALNYQFVKKQSFGALRDTNTDIMIREANSLGIDTSKMEKLMKDVYPDGVINTYLYYDDGKTDVIKIDLTYRIGKSSFDTKNIFKNYIDYSRPFYLVPKQNLGIKRYYIENIIKNLKKIKKEMSE